MVARSLGIELTGRSELYLEYYGIWTDGLADDLFIGAGGGYRY